MPKIELSISTLDIINALKKCRDEYKPKRIAFIGERDSISEAKPFFDLLGCNIEVYSEKYAENIPSVFEIAKKNCCDAFVGGYSVYKFAEFKNEKCVLVKTGKEAILKAVNEAIRSYEILKSSKISKIIIEHSKESILYVGKDFKISLMNPEAQNYLEKIYKIKNFYDRHIKEVFPFMYHNIENVFLKQREINNELHKIDTMNITAAYTPIVIGDEVTGVVINFTSVEKIQQDEIQIRKKLSTKGLHAKYKFDNIIYKSELMCKNY